MYTNILKLFRLSYLKKLYIKLLKNILVKAWKKNINPVRDIKSPAYLMSATQVFIDSLYINFIFILISNLLPRTLRVLLKCKLFYLRNSHVYSAVVLADVEVEILIVNAHVASIGQITFESTVIRAKFFEKICESIAKLYHALGWYRNLRSRATSRYGLRHLEISVYTIMNRQEYSRRGKDERLCARYLCKRSAAVFF